MRIAQLCNAIECEHDEQHWPIFDADYGVQVDDAATIDDAEAKADHVVTG